MYPPFLSENDTHSSHSRCKLREIIWKDLHRKVCGIWAGYHESEGLPDFMTKKLRVENSPDCGMKKKLNMITQLDILEGRPDESSTYLLQWVQQRKDSIHLCCRKMKINGLTKAKVIEVFKIVHANCIQVLSLSFVFLEDLAILNVYLRQMNNILTLNLEHITDIIGMDVSEKLNEENKITWISQLPAFYCLQELYIDDVSFIKGNLKECLRCLKKPLEILYIANCDLSQSDLDYLPCSLNIFELKCLSLTNVNLCYLLLEPLGFLLERVRHTLECLQLKSCHMGESQFNALLPALSQCSRLTEVNFHDNELSLLFMKQILYQTAKLSQLTEEVYPAPLECYYNGNVILTHRLEKFCPDLLDILKAKRQPKEVIFATTQCSKCGGSYVYDWETKCCRFEKDPF